MGCSRSSAEFATLLPALLAGMRACACRQLLQGQAASLPMLESGVYPAFAVEGWIAGGHASQPLPDGHAGGGKYPAGDARIDHTAGSSDMNRWERICIARYG